jgi:hypothetical protein
MHLPILAHLRRVGLGHNATERNGIFKNYFPKVFPTKALYPTPTYADRLLIG